MLRIIIEPGKTEKNYWKDLWHFRELFYILSWRDIKVRYRQTVLGAAWSIIRPLLTTLIFTFVFNKVAPQLVLVITLLFKAIAICQSHDSKVINLTAQTHAISFYKQAGFIETSGIYQDANIPHVDMQLIL